MTDKEALKLALEALETLMLERGSIYDRAITAIKQALAAPVQEPVCIYPRCSCNSKDFCDPKRQQALDKKAENARELGLDYEPHKGLSEHLAQATNGRVYVDPVTGDVGIGTPVAQPAPVQEPVAYVVTTEVHGQMCSFIHRIDLTKLLPDGAKLYTTPPNVATPLAAPDTLTNLDGETPEYVNGWNDCRQLMMDILRKESK